MSAKRLKSVGKVFTKIKDSGNTKEFLVFLLFVCIAAVFWFIIALNDEVQISLDVPVRIEEVPDSVTFITPPPASIHVTVRDKGTNLLRHKVTGVPELHLKFSEFAANDHFRLSHTGLSASLRHLLGNTSNITSVSPDSISLFYTNKAPVRVPVELDYDVTVAPGMVLGKPKLSESSVDVFGITHADTLRKVITDRIVLRDLDRTTTIEVPLHKMAGKRIEPSSIKVTFVVEQLVKKEAEVAVEADNIPLGQDILFFPSRVRVAYFVPMSRYNDSSDPIKVVASFDEAVRTSSDKVGLKAESNAPYISNLELLQDSVEYTLVRSN